LAQDAISSSRHIRISRSLLALGESGLAMGNGAVGKQRKHSEPFHVEVTPRSGALYPVERRREEVVAVAPYSKKALRSQSEPGKKTRTTSKGKRALAKQSSLDDGLGQILDPARLHRQRVMAAASPQKAKSKLAHTDIERMFPGLIDADDMATKSIQTVDAELTGTMHKDLDKRRCLFRQLCLQWHASRHHDKPSARWAGNVQRHLMAQRDWYLAPNAKMPPNLAADMVAARSSLLNDTYGDAGLKR